MASLKKFLVLATALLLLAAPALVSAGGSNGPAVKMKVNNFTRSSDDINNIRYVTASGQVEVKGGPLTITGAEMWVTYFDDLTHAPRDTSPVSLGITGAVSNTLKTSWSGNWELQNASGGRGVVIHLRVTTADGQVTEASVSADR